MFFADPEALYGLRIMILALACLLDENIDFELRHELD